MTFTIAPLTHDEVEDYAHTHIELTIGTYAHLVDAEFARARRAELAERVAELHADLDACATLDAHPKARDPYGEVENEARLANRRRIPDAGIAALTTAGVGVQTHFRRHFIARNARGGVVGVAASGIGVGDWEIDVCGDAWVPPATDWTLDHLYTVTGMHGSGLGQAMLDAALPGRRPAYLWVFTDNVRAVRFYERNGFVPDGLKVDSGESWGSMPMVRMQRA